jgi:hypothetical protein
MSHECIRIWIYVYSFKIWMCFGVGNNVAKKELSPVDAVAL